MSSPDIFFFLRGRIGGPLMLLCDRTPAALYAKKLQSDGKAIRKMIIITVVTMNGLFVADGPGRSRPGSASQIVMASPPCDDLLQRGAIRL